jgi:hypothetical protein
MQLGLVQTLRSRFSQAHESPSGSLQEFSSVQLQNLQTRDVVTAGLARSIASSDIRDAPRRCNQFRHFPKFLSCRVPAGERLSRLSQQQLTELGLRPAFEHFVQRGSYLWSIPAHSLWSLCPWFSGRIKPPKESRSRNYDIPPEPKVWASAFGNSVSNRAVTGASNPCGFRDLEGYAGIVRLRLCQVSLDENQT